MSTKKARNQSWNHSKCRKRLSDLHVHELYGAPIPCGNYTQYFHASAVTIPRLSIFKNLSNLTKNSHNHYSEKIQFNCSTTRNMGDTTTHLSGFKTHKAAGSCCHTTTVAGNSNDSNRIRTRLLNTNYHEKLDNIVIIVA